MLNNMLSRLHKFCEIERLLAEPRLTNFVHVVGIKGESLDVIHGGLSELVGQEMFGESVWVKTATLNIFSAYVIRKLICFNFTVGIRFISLILASNL